MKKVNLTLTAFLIEGAALFIGWEKKERKGIKPIKATKFREQYDGNLKFEDLCYRLDNMLRPLPQK